MKLRTVSVYELVLLSVDVPAAGVGGVGVGGGGAAAEPSRAGRIGIRGAHHLGGMGDMDGGEGRR